MNHQRMLHVFRRLLIATLVVASVVTGAVLGWRWYEAQHREQVLVLATGPRDTDAYAFGQRLAQLVAASSERLTIRVIETNGARENYELLADGTVQLALISGDVPLSLDMQVVDVLFPEMVHVLVRPGADITEMADLNGRTIGLLPEGSTSRALFWPIAQHYGLRRDDVKVVTLLPHEAAAALRRGTADAYFLVIALDARATQYIIDRASANLIDIDQAAALRFRAPFLEEGEIPKGTYRGAPPIPPRDLPTVAVRTMLVSARSLDANLTYSIVRIMHERRKDFIAENLSAAFVAEPALSPLDQGLPMHAGAIDYYERDRPWFFVEYAEPIGVGMSIVLLLGSWVWAIKLKADRHSKNRADDYNAQVIGLAERVQRVDDLDNLDALRNELFLVFRKVFSDLDEDRITPASIQGFTLAWYVAAQLLQERRSALSRGPSAMAAGDAARPVALP